MDTADAFEELQWQLTVTLRRIEELERQLEACHRREALSGLLAH